MIRVILPSEVPRRRDTVRDRLRLKVRLTAGNIVTHKLTLNLSLAGSDLGFSLWM
jgi:hypothetical protein